MVKLVVRKAAFRHCFRTTLGVPLVSLQLSFCIWRYIFLNLLSIKRKPIFIAFVQCIGLHKVGASFCITYTFPIPFCSVLLVSINVGFILYDCPFPNNRWDYWIIQMIILVLLFKDVQYWRHYEFKDLTQF